ncbi:hypothetical protein LguiA_028218 [Lonicera macranthoides]
MLVSLSLSIYLPSIWTIFLALVFLILKSSVKTEMDSTDSFKASSKLNLLEDPSSKTTNSQKPRLVVAIFFIFLLISIIAAIITIYIISNTHLSLLVANPTDPIRTVCSVTRYRQSCYSTISSMSINTTESDWPEPNPESIASLSIRVVENELENISSLLETLISNSTTNRETQSSSRDCRNLFLHALRVKNPVVSLNRVGIREAKRWLSLAMSGEEECLGRLGEIGRTVDGDELRLKVYKLRAYVSNSLEIVSKMKIIREKFYDPPQLSDYVLILPQYLVLIFLFCLLFRLG